LFGKTPLKAQNDYIFQTFWGAMAPLTSTGYAYGGMTSSFTSPAENSMDNAVAPYEFMSTTLSTSSLWSNCISRA